MKTVLSAFTAILILTGCYSFKEAQVQAMDAELVRIDTIYRYERHEQVLTWKSEKNTQFISYAAIGPVFTVGSRVKVFVRR
ncbi:MAG: hypothetical protein WCF67_07090 [Chitinophagaceae bacterium]